MITFVISLKLLLALALTAVPLVFWLYVRPHSKQDGKYRNLFALIASHSDKFARLKKKLESIIDSFANGLVYSKKIRKFYVILMVIGMLTTEIVDLQTSRYIARFITSSIGNDMDKAAQLEFMYPILSHPLAQMIAIAITLACLSYRIANHYLTKIHDSIWLFSLNCVLVVVLCIAMDQRFLVLGEVCFIMLTAAVYYPDYYYARDEYGNDRNSDKDEDKKSAPSQKM